MTDNVSGSLVTTQLAERYDYLAPDGSEIRLLPTVGRGGLCHCTLPSGGVAKAVQHQTVEEIWYCLSGAGQIWRKLGHEEEIIDLRPGVSLTIPTGAHFQFRNTDTTPLCVLIATMPPWPGPDEAVPVAPRWEYT